MIKERKEKNLRIKLEMFYKEDIHIKMNISGASDIYSHNCLILTSHKTMKELLKVAFGISLNPSISTETC